jgi:Transmembrane exosortase (Exosortase_EpsH)
MRIAAHGLDLRFATRFAQGPIAWAVWIFFARYLADAWRGSDASLGHLANLGIFQLLAWMVTLVLVARGDETRRPSGLAASLIGLISLTAVLPDDNASWVGLSALAAYIFFSFPRDRNLRAAAAVMLALATQLFWGRILFELVAFRIEILDAKLAADLLSLLHHSVSLQDNLLATDTHQIVIYEACTSFHNISIAMLAWVAITKFFRPVWRSADLATAAVLIVVTVAMNSLRLFLMASSAPGLLDYWHVGLGSQMINASLSALITVTCLWSVRSGSAP